MTTNERLYRGAPSRKGERSLKAKRIATQGEDLAVKYLKGCDFSIMARNFRAGRAGEIDIVAVSPEQIVVFVEVKARTLESEPFGIPEIGFEAVGYRKQQRIISSALRFLKDKELSGCRWRYDVVVVHIFESAFGESAGVKIIHVDNAFN